MSEPKTNIPKFASFKPRPSPAVPEHLKEETSKPKENSRSRKDGKHHHRRYRSRSREVEVQYKLVPSLVEERPQSRDEQLDIFVVDRKGDLKNLVYGSVHRYSVPPFRRFGAGSVLGVPATWKIDRSYTDEKGLVLSNRSDSKFSSREKYAFSKLEKEKPLLLRIRSGLIAEPHDNYEKDFISIEPRGRKRKRGGDGDSGSENGNIDYRSIHGKAKAQGQPLDEDLQYATASDGSDSDNDYAMRPDLVTREMTMKLSRNVENYPNDINGWLALIEHQDTLLRAGDDQKRITNAEIQSTAEIKIHMYEKALEKATTLSDRETLLLGLMSEGSKVWDTRTQSERWEKISNENIDSLLLWKSYLSFRQTTFASFRYEEIREIFSQRITLLLKTRNSAVSSKHEALSHQLLYVLLRLTVFLRESGYLELAIAIWQGLLEFNLFAPASINLQAENVTLFKEFWDSEVPRIGENGALGWSHFVSNPSSSEPPASLNDEEAESLDVRHIFVSWAKSERLRHKTSYMPARTMDEVTEDDPFRVILASDIESFLIPLDSDSESMRTSLINTFLLFCGLPPVVTQDSSPLENWSSDQFIRGSLLKGGFKQANLSTPQNLDQGIEINISSIFNTPTSKFAMSSESMFGRLWFKSLEPWQINFPGGDGPGSYEFVKTTLQQLTKTCFNVNLGEYCLAFEWQNEPATIKKVAKSLLKQHPSSLLIYNAYGMIEWARGNKAIADAVFSTALDMCKSMREDDQKDSIILWKSWIWASLEDLNNDTAIRRLLSIADGSMVEATDLTPAIMLKARHHFSSHRDHSLSSGDTKYAIIYAEFLALLEYLSSRSLGEPQSQSQGNISGALISFENFSQVLKTRKLSSGIHHELFLQSATRLLYHHARIGPFRPALLRQHLTESIEYFPQNTIFLSLYTFNESRLRVENRVRSILNSTILSPQNDMLTSRLFAIQYEIEHGTIHSTQSAFEHALNSTTSKYSVGVWKLYILFCLQTPKFVPQIKDVWYRALRACPWAKELFILGFENMEGIVDYGELKGTWRVMGEKELRVHVDLEDEFDEIGDLVQDNDRGRIKKLGLK